MRRRISLALSLVLAAAACGGSSDSGSTDPNNTNTQTPTATNGVFTAVINGATWNAVGTVSVTRGSNNFVGISGTGFTTGTNGYSFVIGIGNASGPATYSLSFGNVAGSELIVGGLTGGWGTYFNGGTGSLTITTLNTNHIAGTFTADPVPSSGGATGTLQVRNGRFDLTF
jgi:hypothetical protein